MRFFVQHCNCCAAVEHCSWQANRLLKPRLHDTTCCQTGCQTGLTAGWMFVYTIQPVAKPVVKPVWQPVVSSIQTFNRLSNQFDNRFDNRLYRVYSQLSTGCIVYTAGCQTGCQGGCTTRFDNRLHRVNKHPTGCHTSLTTGWMFVYTMQPVDNRLYNRLSTGCIVYTGY